MKKITTLILVICSALPVFSKTVSGYVYGKQDKRKIPLVGAFIKELNQPNGTVTEENGFFTIDVQENTQYLVVTYVSFLTDTVDITGKEAVEIVLNQDPANLGVVNINRRRNTFGIRTLDAKTTFQLREQEFQKAACCNLSESFENAPSIDVSFTDAVTGTKQIKMLGLDGVYSAITREMIPAVRGLNSFYGLSFIPASWVESIQITKGAGSVVNGYESISGQINIEMKKPFGKDQLMVDQFVSESGRTETDFMIRKDLSKNLATSFFGRYGARPFAMDRNGDNFLDNPLSSQYQFMNRWQFATDKGIEGQFSASYNNDTKQAGQTGVESLYVVNIDNEQVDLWAKLGKTYKDKPYKSFGSQYAFNTVNSTTVYGNDTNSRSLKTKGSTAYVNLMYQSIFGNTMHSYKTGVSVLSDWTDESLDSLHFERNEVVPGMYFEYTWKPDSQFIMVAGVRGDVSSIFGFFPTYRLHLKRTSKSEKTTWRLSFGNGWRTPNILAQNQNLFFSSREIRYEDNSTFGYGLIQEKAWNMGLSLHKKLKIRYIPTDLTIDFFRSQFENELLVNRETSNVFTFSEQKNGTISNSLQAQLDLKPARRTEIRLAYRMFDVTSVYQNTRLMKPLLSKHRGFINITQQNRKKWQFSTTLQLYGQQRIPGYIFGTMQQGDVAKYSPSFPLWGAQVSKTISKRPIEWYLGVENILNYRQDNPIIGYENPFGASFDATNIWGPIFGRMIYGGFRYRIKIKDEHQ